MTYEIPCRSHLGFSLEQGYGLAATLHADTPEQLFDYLAASPLRIPPVQLARLGLIIALGFFLEPGGWVRRVRTASLVLPNNRDGLPATMRLAEWEQSEGCLRHNGSGEATDLLARRLGLDSGALAQELTRRQEFLGGLLRRGETSVEQVRAAVFQFYLWTGQ